LLLSLSGFIITELTNLPENLYLKVFSGEKFGKRFRMKISVLFLDNLLALYPTCVD